MNVCGGGRLFPRAPKPKGVEISPIVSSEAVSSGGWSLTGQDQTIAVPQEPTFAVARAASQQSVLNHQNLMRPL